VSAWEETKRGHLRAALVGGEPGIGKTRLVAELAQRACVDGGAALYGRCDEELGVPYQPFVGALRAYLDNFAPDEIARRAGVTAAELGQHSEELGALLPGMGEPTSGEAETERFLLFEAIRGLLERASKETPLLLVLDDLHWAARPTLQLLRHVLRSPEAMPMMVVGTFRDTELHGTPALADTLADLRRDPDIDRISLRGLAPVSPASPAWTT
jgi:predicted ATPase